MRSKSFFQLHERGRIKGEDLYSVWGKTEGGRYLVVFVLLKKGKRALPISARLMTEREK